MIPDSIILIYSGGLDSTVLLYNLKAQGYALRALSFNYGQRHAKELYFARWHTDRLGVEHRIADLSAIKPLLAGSSQTSDDVAVPEGHYAEESMKATIVPNRNMIMMAVAGGWAASVKASAVAYAAHAGDHSIYPDCRPAFADAIAAALGLCDWNPIKLLRPFIKSTKAEIVAEGARLGVPFEQTWSCYKGGELHCGKCGTDVERREAFALAGVADPTQYQSGLAGLA